MNNSFDLQYMVHRIEQLCRAQGSDVKNELIKAGVSRDVVANMKKGSVPSIDKVFLIASHFNVSIDSLLGIETNQTAEHSELMRLFDTLDDDSKEIIARLIVKIAKV